MMSVVNVFGYEVEEAVKCFDSTVVISVTRRGLVHELNARCLDTKGRIKRIVKDLISVGTIQSHVLLHEKYGVTITVA